MAFLYVEEMRWRNGKLVDLYLNYETKFAVAK
jgi:hypothetical protein